MRRVAAGSDVAKVRSVLRVLGKGRTLPRTRGSKIVYVRIERSASMVQGIMVVVLVMVVLVVAWCRGQ